MQDSSVGNYDVGEGGGRTGPHARMDHGEWRGGPGDGTRTCRPHGCTGHGTWHSAEFDRATVHCAGSIATSVQSAYNPRRARAGRSGLRRVSTVTVVCVASASRSAGRLQPPPPRAAPRGARCWRPRAAVGLGVASVRQESGPRRNVNAEFRLQGLFDSHHAAAASIRAAGNLTPVNRVNSVRINLARLSTVTHTRRGTANETCRAAPAHIAGRRHRP